MSDRHRDWIVMTIAVEVERLRDNDKTRWKPTKEEIVYDLSIMEGAPLPLRGYKIKEICLP